MKEFDIVISLGGNCSAALQLKQRGLRTCSMPFDYFFLRNSKDLEGFIFAFKNDFSNCFLKENLRELSKEERGGSDLFQYQDTVSRFNIIHMFHKSKETPGYYESVKKIIDRRLKRFFKYCKPENKVCFIMAIDFCVDKKLIYELYNIIKAKFGANHSLIFFMFDSSENTDFAEENLRIIKLTRKINLYDYYKTNNEWAFLDDIKLSKKAKDKKYLIKISKIKKGISIHLFNFIPTILKNSLYLFGLRIIICVGKDRSLWC